MGGCPCKLTFREVWIVLHAYPSFYVVVLKGFSLRCSGPKGLAAPYSPQAPMSPFNGVAHRLNLVACLFIGAFLIAGMMQT
jgi:hypothetical protein